MVRDSIVRDSALDEYTATAKAIAFDTCHKIYVLMDDEQVALMREYEYEMLFTSDELTPSQMSDKVAEWFENSCSLRFISAVSTNHLDPNEGFIHIVEQFEGQEDEDEDED
jgi:hypothetical protein